MKILFPIKDLGSTDMLAIMYLSAIIRGKGHEMAIVDAAWKQVFPMMQAFQPDVVGYSVTTHEARFYFDLNRRLKKQFGFLSLFGGAHPTYFPECISEEDVDAICIGEGEHAFLDLMGNLRDGLPITNIPNWWVKQDRRIFRNTVRPLIEDLDSLPFPDRTLFDAIPRRERQNTQSFIASRGCAFACSFCFNESFNKIYKNKGKTVRLRSVDNVLAEIKEVMARHRLDFINFLDNVFIWSEAWGEEFAEKYSKEIHVPFFCCVQPRHLNERIVGQLKKAGCHSVGLGVEAADNQVLREIVNKGVTRERIVEVSRLIKQSGIRLNTYNIIGLPGSSLAKEIETLRLNIEIRPDFAGSTIYDPMPGTALAKIAADMGLLEEKSLSSMDGTHSVLKFTRQDYKLERENLARIFPVVTEFPFLMPLLRICLKFPLTGLYSYFYRAFEGYCSYFRLFPREMTWRIFFRNVYYFLHHDRG
jgi:radical SAM superfamily enzyme YgiQ (UPF0313 family)